MARLIAIDYGTKRTGLAVTDPLGIIASPLETVDTKQLERYLADYFAKEDVSTIVVGEPWQPNGQPSENLQRVRSFVELLKKNFPDKEIVLYDERFTSVIAHRTMIDAGLHKKARQDKSLVDEISATIILQDYMESRRFHV